jgi:hypothetical protein
VHVAALADGDDGGVGVVLAADQLVRLGDPDDVDDARHRPQVEPLEGDDVADEADDRAVDPAADEGRAAGQLDPGDDGVDVLRGGTRAHDDDHRVPLDTRLDEHLRHAGQPRAQARGSGRSVPGSRPRDVPGAVTAAGPRMALWGG